MLVMSLGPIHIVGGILGAALVLCIVALVFSRELRHPVFTTPVSRVPLPPWLVRWAYFLDAVPDRPVPASTSPAVILGRALFVSPFHALFVAVVALLMFPVVTVSAGVLRATRRLTR